MRRIFLYLGLSASLWGFALPCRAETISICEAASSDDYLTKASGQFLRGATNIGFCWLEMIHQPALEARRRGNLFVGIFKGAGHTALRLIKGVGDIATFLAPHRDEYGAFSHVANDCAFGAVGLEDR